MVSLLCLLFVNSITSIIIGTAEDGFDYTAVNSNLSFPAATSDNTMRCMDVNITDDSVFEESENFTVTVTTTDPQVAGNNMLTLTIIDNEGQQKYIA